MSPPSREPPLVRRGAFGQFVSGRPDPADVQRPQRARLPIRLVVGVLSALLLVASALHIGPAVRAGLHDGTHGFWVAAAKTCRKSACVWSGKFVDPGGHVIVDKTQYAGHLPANIHVGSSVPALFSGGSGLVFPRSGSDLWIELLIAVLVSLLALYWASHRWVAAYLRQRREDAAIARPI